MFFEEKQILLKAVLNILFSIKYLAEWSYICLVSKS
ncbi:hypothetical protein SAMN05216323_101735 [Williamwhitmania taraxaci]|uniref:Uncharacterized protein n=1 Tax=Williamwhitmania taraxaci TaxID=1640674 RepID=A0A1G6IUU0_9BACT|nr:hypothetical protein SAMN05216323_101735 [Williamwhitmania taraxaci]